MVEMIYLALQGTRALEEGLQEFGGVGGGKVMIMWALFYFLIRKFLSPFGLEPRPSHNLSYPLTS